MSRVSIYAASPVTLEAIASLIEDEPELEILDRGERAPQRLPTHREGDLVVASMDLPVSERLRILGFLWRSHHPPRILFVDGRRDGGGAGRCVVDADGRERCLAAIGSLEAGETRCARVEIRLLEAPPARRSATPAVAAIP